MWLISGVEFAEVGVFGLGLLEIVCFAVEAIFFLSARDYPVMFAFLSGSYRTSMNLKFIVGKDQVYVAGFL